VQHQRARIAVNTTNAFKSDRRDFLIATIALLFGVAFLAVLAVPNHVSHRTGEVNAIINNLRRLDGAMQQWVIDRGETNSVSVTREDIAPYVKDGWVKPIAGEEYSLNSFPKPPEARLTRRVQGHPKGTIIRYGDDLEIIEPK
jgi:hypothetical protein